MIPRQSASSILSDHGMYFRLFFLNILEYDQSVMIWTIKQLNDPFQSIVFSVSRSCSFDDCFMSGSRRAKALTSWPRRHQRVINPVNSLFGC